MEGEKAVRGAPCSHPSPTGAVLRISLNEASPTRRGRPAGVLGAEVWVKLVDAGEPAPTNLAALVFLTITIKPTFRAEFRPGEGGNREF